jgi:hypothetical protein
LLDDKPRCKATALLDDKPRCKATALLDDKPRCKATALLDDKPRCKATALLDDKPRCKATASARQARRWSGVCRLSSRVWRFLDARVLPARPCPSSECRCVRV